MPNKYPATPIRFTPEDRQRIEQIKSQYNLPDTTSVIRFLLHQKEAPSTALVPVDAIQLSEKTRDTLTYIGQQINSPSLRSTIARLAKAIAVTLRGDITPDQLFSALKTGA